MAWGVHLVRWMSTHPLLASAELLLERGRVTDAIQVYHEILADSDAPVEVNLRLGRLYQRQGENEMALFRFQIVADNSSDGPVKLAALQQMVKLDPDQPTHRLRLAELYRKGGSHRQAFREYSKATELMCAGAAGLAEVMECLVHVMPGNTSLANELARLRKLPSAGLALDTVVEKHPVVEFQAVETRNGYQPLMGSGSTREALRALDEQPFVVEGDGVPDR